MHITWIRYQHGYIAYMFLVTSRGRKPVSSVQRTFSWGISAVLVITAVSITLETFSYTKRISLNPMAVEVIFSGACLCFVICCYAGTCLALVRRTWRALAVESSSEIIKAKNMAIAKLLVIVAVFILVWVWVVVNNIKYLINDDSSAVHYNNLFPGLVHISICIALAENCPRRLILHLPFSPLGGCPLGYHDCAGFCHLGRYV